MLDAFKNGKPMELKGNLFKLNQDDCFDMFFVNKPRAVMDKLPKQMNFCMGRCDGRYMNSTE